MVRRLRFHQRFGRLVLFNVASCAVCYEVSPGEVLGACCLVPGAPGNRHQGRVGAVIMWLGGVSEQGLQNVLSAGGRAGRECYVVLSHCRGPNVDLSPEDGGIGSPTRRGSWRDPARTRQARHVRCWHLRGRKRDPLAQPASHTMTKKEPGSDSAGGRKAQQQVMLKLTGAVRHTNGFGPGI